MDKMRTLNQKTEGEYALVRSCIKGNRSSHQAMYAKYSPKMFAVCLRYGKDYHSAEDILQEGFIKAFKNLEKFRFEGSFEGWLRRIFVNTAIEHFRKHTTMYPIMDYVTAGNDTMNDMTVNKMAAEDIMKLVNKLSPGYKAVFNLYVVEGYPHKDIAEMLGISIGTSKSQLARARYLLQKMVTDLEQRENRAYVR